MSYVTVSDVEEIVDDALDDVPEPRAMEAANVRSPSGLSGQIGYKELKSELSGSRRGVDVPPAAETQEDEIEYSTVTYTAKKQVGRAFVPEESQIQMGQYDIDAVEDAADTAVQDARFNVEHKFADFLENSSGMGSWTQDSGNYEDNSGDPYGDIVTNVRQTYGADTIVLGDQVLQELRQHADTKEQDANYAGTGQVSEEITKQKIRQAHGSIDNVLVLDNVYDSAALGLSPTQARLYDKRIAAFHSSRLLAFDPNDELNPNTLIGEDIDRAAFQIRHHRYVDFQFPITEFGQEGEVIT